MPEEKLTTTNKSHSPDWYLRGILTKFGETFDKLTGRNWQPSSSLATSELIERMKKMLDAKVKNEGAEKGRFVPHHIKLKMQWDKFSTDAEDSLKKLENELLIAAIDHINDNRYHTFAPVKVEVKTDYFTEGVDLSVTFDKFDNGTDEIVSKVTMPQADLRNIVVGTPEPLPEPAPETEKFIVQFKIGNTEKQTELEFLPRGHKQVGRLKESDLVIDDASISKIHAGLVLNAENQLMVADTGSTNGTFINGNRIAYGQAFMIGDSDRIRFGTVEVFFRRVPKPVEFSTRNDYETEEKVEFNQSAVKTEVYDSGRLETDYKTNTDFETSQKIEQDINKTASNRVNFNFDKDE